MAKSRSVETSVSLIKNSKGQPVGFRGMIRDITERKQAEDLLRESEARFRDLVDNSLTGIFIIQHDRIVYRNSELERLLGPLSQTFNFKNFENIHPEEVEKVKEAYEKMISGKTCSLDIDMRVFPFGTGGDDRDMRWVHCRANVMEYRGQKAVLVNMMDLTRFKELEHLVKVEDKMTSLGRVAAGIIHELRNPLSGINVYLSALKKAYDCSGGQGEESLRKVSGIIEKLQSASDRIELVIRRVMDFSKPSAPKLALIDINQPIEEAINLSTVTLRKSGIAMEKSLSENLPLCYADPMMIEQVVLNLITNAAQAMKNTKGMKKIEITSQAEGNHILLRVADSGPGVPLILRKKIFDPFFTTKKDSSGIGLSLCHRMILDHGGSLTVETGKWGGAEFRIEMPIEKRMTHK